MRIMTGDHPLWELGVSMLTGASGGFREQRAENRFERYPDKAAQRACPGLGQVCPHVHHRELTILFPLVDGN